MSGPDSELSLIERAVAGDRVALSQLLLLHFNALHQHVESRISHRLQGLMRADDVLQQTFVRAAQAIGTFELRHAGAFRGWLRTIADNLVRDAEKRRRRERRFPAFCGAGRWRADGHDAGSARPTAGIGDVSQSPRRSGARRCAPCRRRWPDSRTINAKYCGGGICWGSPSNRLPPPRGGRAMPCAACAIERGRTCALPWGDHRCTLRTECP